MSRGMRAHRMKTRSGNRTLTSCSAGLSRSITPGDRAGMREKADHAVDIALVRHDAEDCGEHRPVIDHLRGGVDRIGGPGERHHRKHLLLRGVRHARQFKAEFGRGIRHLDADAARYRHHANARRLRKHAARARVGDIDQFIERARAMHVVFAEHCVEHRIGAGERAGMRGDRRDALAPKRRPSWRSPACGSRPRAQARRAVARRRGSLRDRS